jgi:predicted oxidoreductase
MRTCSIPRTELVVTRLGYGIGMLDAGWRIADFRKKCTHGIQTAYDQGITFFDTADVYAEGRSEEALGHVLTQSSMSRDQVVIQTKCGLRIRAGWAPGDSGAGNFFGVDLRYDYIVSAVEASLARLRTDRIDVLLLHASSPLVEPEEVAHAFDQLHRDGKVLHFGVSGHTATQMDLLRKYLRRPLVVNQIWLSLLHHAPITESSGFGALVDHCRLHGVQVQAYSPLKGNSIFAKPILLAPPPDAELEVHELARVLAELASGYKATPAAVMLAWLMRHPVGIVPIIGATTQEHIIENCAADRFELTRDDWELLCSLALRIKSTG